MSSKVTAVIWTNYADPAGLHKLILENPQLRWVQLPFAGVDAFAAVIADPVIRQRGVVFTSAKGSYREPVAEINALEAEIATLTDEALKARTPMFREQLAAGLDHPDEAGNLVGSGGDIHDGQS